MNKHIVFVYEENQVPTAIDFLQKSDSSSEYIIVALRADIELLLDEQGVEYQSVVDYRETDSTDRLLLVEDILQCLETETSLDSVKHRDIRLIDLQMIIIQDYLTILLYWIEIMVRVTKEYEPKSIIIWESNDTAHKENILSHRKIGAVTIAANLVASQQNIYIDIHPHLGSKNFWMIKLLFNFKRALFSFFLYVQNIILTIITPTQDRKLLVADIWRNVGPYVAELENTEIIMIDRMECFKMGWKNIRRHRARFFDQSNYNKFSYKRIANNVQSTFKNLWLSNGNQSPICRNMIWKGILLDFELQTLLKIYMCHSIENDVKEIEQTYRMLEVHRPNAVMVRASASRQKHLMILCLVAKNLSIPSIEPQHGWYYTGPSGTHRRSAVEYMATYGPYCTKEFNECGYKGTCENIGSPRFDVYSKIKKNKLETNSLKIFISLFDDMTGRWTDTYDIKEFIVAISHVLKSNSDISFILSAKPNNPGAAFVLEIAERELSHYPNFSLVTDKSLAQIMEEVDVVVTIFSTVLLEAMLAGCVVLYWAQPPFHKSVIQSKQIADFKIKSGVEVVNSQSNLQEIITALRASSAREVKINQGNRFIRDYFSFTPGSSKRMATLITKLTNRS